MLWKVLHVYRAACFTLRGHCTHIDLLWLLFLVGRIFPSDVRAFSSLTSFEALSFLLRLIKGCKFFQSAFWI